MSRREQGGVSIFIVVLVTLIISVITVSFTQLMVKNQQQATTNDLSQSAYDSALAGVEDAKRVLIKNRECGGSSAPECTAVRTAISDQECQTIQKSGLKSLDDREVVVSDELNQAYTCVIVQTDTSDFVAETGQSGAFMIPLDSSSAIEKVKLTWYTQNDREGTDGPDYQGAHDIASASVAGTTAVRSLPPNSVWGTGVPPILRAQFILDNDNSRTAFLRPVSDGSDDSEVAQVDLNAVDSSGRNNSENQVPLVTCNSTFSERPDGVCSAMIDISDVGSTPSHLLIQSIYADSATVTVEPFGSDDNPIKFRDVQPIVDSTGRASDLFRRVSARVLLTENGTNDEPVYPNAALKVQRDLCKTFFITNRDTDYDPGSCDPAEIKGGG